MAVSRRNYGEPAFTDLTLGGGIGVSVYAPSTLGDGLRVQASGQAGFAVGDRLLVLVEATASVLDGVGLSFSPINTGGATWTRLYKVLNTTGGTQAPTQIEAWWADATQVEVDWANGGGQGLAKVLADTSSATVYTQAFAYTGHDGTAPLFATASETDSDDSVSLPALTAARAGSMALRQFATIDPIDNPPGAVTGLTITGYQAASSPYPIRAVHALDSATVVNAAAVAVPWSNDASAQVAGATIVVRAPNTVPTQPGAFTTPTSGQIVDTTITPSWGASTDPDSSVTYDLHFTRDNWATSSLIADNTSATSYVHNVSGVAASTACAYRVYAYDADGAVSPVRESPLFTVEHNIAPTAPTGLSPAGNVVLDRTITQRFSWTFNDPNTGDSQSKYDLRYRVVGASTWTTVTATTPNRFHDFAAATFAAGDYEWQVLTYDSQGVASPWSASEFFKAATPPAAPSITSPVNNATVSTSSGVVEWSYPSQTSFQVRKVADNAGSPDTATVYYDSAEVVSTSARNHPLSYPVNSRVEHIQVRVKDAGLWSSWSSVKITVSFTAPAVPTLTVAAVNTLGLGGTDSLTVTITHPTPTGTQPTVTSSDVYRRTDSGDGVRVAAEVGTSWTDYTPASGVAYEYKAVAHGANGVDSDSVWTS